MHDVKLPGVHPFSTPDLLVRPAPGRFEGPQGYLLRLAEANCLSLHELKQHGARFDAAWLTRNRLMPAEALDPDLHAHVHRLSSLIQDKGRVWNQRHARFCPLCLSEDPTWRASWEVLFHDACPNHGVWLVDKCASCAQPVQWRRDSLLRCQCGADLRQEAPGVAPESLRILARTLEESLLGRESSQHPVLSGLTLEQVQRLVRYLGGYLDPSSGPKPLKLRNASLLEASWPVTSLAAEILAQWPQSFHDCWSRMQSETAGDKVGLKGVFRRAHFYLYKGLWESAYRPVRDAFEIWLSEHWRGGLSKRNRNLADRLLANAHWIPANVAADQLGISVRKLRCFVRDGFLDGQESISITGRNFIVVRRDQLERVAAESANEITMKTAIQMLGLGKLRAARVLKLLFPAARRSDGAGNLPWCIPHSEVDALLALGDGLPVVTIPDEQEVALAHVLRYWAWSTELVATLVDTVKSGQLKPVSVWEGGRGIGAWIFNRTLLKGWCSAVAGGNLTWVSIPETARMLGIKQQVAYWLCQNGYLSFERLRSRSEHRNRDLGSRVRVTEVERFRREYIFGRDIASGLRTSSRRSARVLAEEGIYPIRGHTVIPPRMLIYQATDELRRLLATLLGGRPSDLGLMGEPVPQTGKTQAGPLRGPSLSATI